MASSVVENLIRDTVTLKATSKATYLKHVANACEAVGVSSGWELIERGPQVLQPYLRSLAHPSQRNMVMCALTSVWRLDSALRERHLALYREWDACLRSTQSEARKKYENSAPTEGETFVPMEELLSAMRDATVDLESRLILCAHVHAPARCDFGSVRLIESESDRPPESAYYARDARRLYIAQHKTSGVHGALSYTMPQEFEDLLTASLLACPREYLFVGKHNQPMTQHHYSVFVRRRLGKLFGPGVCVNSLRKAYATSHRVSSLSNREQAEVARAMGNSARTCTEVYDFRCARTGGAAV